jgi:hypothetical protein
MVIDNYVLLLYATIWSFFYFVLSHYISSLSRDKWIEYVRSEESDKVLLEALEAVVEEIENRMHDKLQDFQNSFMGSLGPMVRDAKKLDPMNNIRKAAKNNDWTSMIVEYAANKSGLGGVLGQMNPQTTPKEGVNNPQTTSNEGVINAKPPLPKPIKHDFK